MTFKPKQLVGLAIIVTLTFVLFVAALPRLVYASPGDAWADPTCKYRMKISFQHSYTGASTNLIDFPVLVVMSSTLDPQFYSRTDANDIRFYDGNTLLPKETEKWNEAGTGNSYIWVKIPQIDANSNTDYIYAYYGSSTENTDSATSVWPVDQFAIVMHLKEDSGNRLDSTSNGFSGTPASGVSKASSGVFQRDGADSFDGTTNGYISVPDDDKLDFGENSFTYSFWFYSKAGTTQDVIDKKTKAADNIIAGYKMVISSVPATGFSAALADGTNFVRLDTGTDSRRAGNVWALFTVVVDRTPQTMTIYIDGATSTSPSWTKSISSVKSVSNGNPLRLGGTTDGTNYRYFNGYLDEVRISKVARSADWIKADYLSTKNQFLTFGSVEEGSRSIESCDSDGVKKDDFTPSDAINVKGTGGYATSTTYPLYVVSDVSWSDGMAIPARVLGTETTVTSDAEGNIPTTPVWGPPLTPGKYDIVVDVNGNGYYNQGIDALDDGQTHVTAGFFVIPEYAVGTILALAVCFGGVVVYRKYKHNKIKPS